MSISLCAKTVCIGQACSRIDPAVEEPGEGASVVLDTVDDPLLGLSIVVGPSVEVTVIDVSLRLALDAVRPLWLQVKVVTHVLVLVEQPEVTELTLNEFRGAHDVSDVLGDTVAVDALRVAASAVVGQALGHDLEEGGAHSDLCELVVEDQGWVVVHDRLDLVVDVSGGLEPELEWELDVRDFCSVSLVFGELGQTERVRPRIVVKENELNGLLSALIGVEVDA